MIFFRKNKATLADLIPNDHIDIHSHLLPGIDDGAKNIDDTIYLTNALKSIGIAQFITTPHIYSGVWDNTKNDIETLANKTTALLKTTNIKGAAEYLINDHFIDLFQKKEILTLKDNYVLVEISYLNPPINLYQIIFDLQIAGYNPVLAHPERYSYYHKNFDEYLKLKNAGCLFQLNLLSIVGYYGKEVAHTAKKLLKNGLINFVGTDVHHKKHIDCFYKSVLLKDLQPLKESIANNQFFKIEVI